MIPSEKIDEIRDRADIVEVISEYVPLTKRGSNYIGNCPFHSEKTPSFSVNDVKEIFYCFGCHTGGNVITFLMKYETFSFPEAVRSLAERYNIEIKEERTKGKGDDNEFDAMIDLNKVALKYFREELKGGSGKSARAYLKDRGFEDEILDGFRVGLSRDSWDGLVKHLKAGGHDLELSVKAGLLGKKEDESGKKDVRYFDRFRGRVLFPITDASGRVVGFGGRSMDGSEPKYLNSPESMLFKKASILYGFYQAKREISRDSSAIVVEGYFDLLALHKYGFKSVVATMGTALTPEHVRRLKPYAKTIYTLFDFDEAGIKAAIRGLAFFLEAGIEAKIIVLPDGKDPDDFLKENGAEGLREALKKAEPLMDFFLKRLATKCDLNSARGKADYVDEAAAMILRMKSPVERDHYAKFAAKATGVDLRSIESALGIVKATRKEFKDDAQPSRPPVGEAPKRRASPLLERTILRVVLRHPNLYNEEVREVAASFGDPVMRATAVRLGEVIRDGVFDAGEIFNEIDDEAVRGFIAESLVDDGRGFIESPEKMLADSIGKIKAAGSPKPSTLRLLKELEESGHGDVVKETLERMGGGSLKDDVKSDKAE